MYEWFLNKPAKQMKLRSMIEWCTLPALQEGFLFDVPRLFSCTVDLWAHWYACPSVSPPCFSYSTALSAAVVYCSAPDSAYCGSDGGWGWRCKKKKKTETSTTHASNTNIHKLIIKSYNYSWFDAMTEWNHRSCCVHLSCRVHYFSGFKHFRKHLR